MSVWRRRCGADRARSALGHVVLWGALLLGLCSEAQSAAVTSFAPAGGPQGTPVSIRGSGFASATVVQFNGIGTPFTLNSDSLITCNVPTGAATGPIRVFFGAASVLSPTNFFVGPPPSIGGFSPSGGSPGTAVTVTGSSFAGITTVRFNGVPASFTVQSNSQISTTVPAGAATGPISVSNPAGTSSSAPFFFPPIINSVSPTGGVPGTPVTINGVNLSQVFSVSFNGVGVGFSIQSDTRINTSVPAGATTGPLQVLSVAGAGSVNYFVGPAPTVSALAPLGGPVGTPVLVTGTGFVGVTSVEFGGVSAPFTIQDASSLTATVPGGAVSGLVTVNNPAGTGSSPSAFFVGAAPTVSTMTPSAGPVGSTVSITGAHFTGATDVRFAGGVSASSFTVNSDAAISAVVPPLAVPGPISVTNPAGTGTSLQPFNVSPRILSFTPPSAPAATAVGTVVTVVGYNFSSVHTVEFNGVTANFALVDDQHLTTSVPAGASSGPLTLLSLFGNAVGPFPFEVVQFTQPPHVAGVSWPHWSDVNVPVATGGQDQQGAALVADSTGGSFVAWAESNGSDYGIRLQHLDAFGRRWPGWPAEGIVVADTVGNQLTPRLVADQVGGVIVVWEDGRNGQDIYAQRITSAGQRAVGWVPQGVAVSAAFSSQVAPALCSDGASGAYFTWMDFRNGNGDIYAQHLLANGSTAAGWDGTGLAICTQPSHQQNPSVMRDQAGGIYVAWGDSRFGGPFPFLQRMQGDGLVASGWPLDGVVVSFAPSFYANVLLPAPDGDCLVLFLGGQPWAQRMTSTSAPHAAWPVSGRPLSASGSCQQIAAVSDGQGGAFACWMQQGNSNDIWANHIGAGSAFASGWGPSGSSVCAAPGEQFTPVIVSDAEGGALLSWYDLRSGDWDIYAARLLPNQPLPLGWPLNGAPVSVVPGSHQTLPGMTADGRGNAVVAWSDGRLGQSDIFAQNIDRSSKLGNPEPTLLSTADVPNDQGGKVRVRWAPSYLDSIPQIEVGTYGIWRQTTEQLMRSAVAKGACIATGATRGTEVGPGTFRQIASGAGFTYWEGLGSVPARGQPLYSFVVATLGDSSAAGASDEVYMVDAHAQFGPYFWETAAGTAHSVDNLAPTAPQALAGNFTGSSTALHWHPNTERDLAGYRLYRGSTVGFVPDETSFLAQVADSAFVDAQGGFAYYKLEAVDVHGNRSVPAVVVPPAFAGVGNGTGVARAEFSVPFPNPAGRTARFALRLPGKQVASVAIFDASGRVVRELVAGVLPAGETVFQWDLEDADGRPVAAGLYFARARSVGLDERRRLVVVR